MMENHKFHRPEANGSRPARSRMTEMLSKIKPNAKPDGQVRLRQDRSGRQRREDKERRSSAPPNVINGITPVSIFLKSDTPEKTEYLRVG